MSVVVVSRARVGDRDRKAEEMKWDFGETLKLCVVTDQAGRENGCSQG